MNRAITKLSRQIISKRKTFLLVRYVVFFLPPSFDPFKAMPAQLLTNLYLIKPRTILNEMISQSASSLRPWARTPIKEPSPCPVRGIFRLVSVHTRPAHRLRLCIPARWDRALSETPWQATVVSCCVSRWSSGGSPCLGLGGTGATATSWCRRGWWAARLNLQNVAYGKSRIQKHNLRLKVKILWSHQRIWQNLHCPWQSICQKYTFKVYQRSSKSPGPVFYLS